MPVLHHWRTGQRASEVLIYHFVGAGYQQRQQPGEEETLAGLTPGELEADLEFLMKAAKKVTQIREDLGNVGPVIAEQVEEAMLGRRVLSAKQQPSAGALLIRSRACFRWRSPIWC